MYDTDQHRSRGTLMRSLRFVYTFEPSMSPYSSERETALLFDSRCCLLNICISKPPGRHSHLFNSDLQNSTSFRLEVMYSSRAEYLSIGTMAATSICKQVATVCNVGPCCSPLTLQIGHAQMSDATYLIMPLSYSAPGAETQVLRPFTLDTWICKRRPPKY